VIPAAALLVVAAVAFDLGMHVPLYQTLVAVGGVLVGCVLFVRLLVGIQSKGAAIPASRPVRGVVVHRPDVYRIPRQEALTLPATRLRALRGGQDEAAS
jgi:hypothetical protein